MAASKEETAGKTIKEQMKTSKDIQKAAEKGAGMKKKEGDKPLVKQHDRRPEEGDMLSINGYAYRVTRVRPNGKFTAKPAKVK